MNTLEAPTFGIIELPTNWICNGSINPLLNTVEKIKQVSGSAWREAVRYAEIELSCYAHQPSIEIAKISDAEAEALVERWLAWKQAPVWTHNKELLPGIKTTAQLLAKHGNLDCNAECIDLADLLECFRLMGSYNEWDAEIGIKEFKKFGLKAFYGLDNPNTSRAEAFKYSYGWEGSHAVYIRACFYRGLRVLNRDQTQWTTISRQEFEILCRELGRKTHADESMMSESGETSATWRLWWD